MRIQTDGMEKAYKEGRVTTNQAKAYIVAFKEMMEKSWKGGGDYLPEEIDDFWDLIKKWNLSSIKLTE